MSNISHSVTAYANLSQLPIVEGQMTFVSDKNTICYDIGGVRHYTGSIELVTELPPIESAQVNVIYAVDDGSGSLESMVLDPTANEYKQLSGNRILTEELDAIMNVYGSKNLCPSSTESLSESGLEFVPDSNGVIEVTGTSTASTIYAVTNSLVLEPGSYFLNGCPEGGLDGNALNYFLKADVITQPDGTHTIVTDTGEGSEMFTIAEPDPSNPNPNLGLCVVTFEVESGVAISQPLYVKPMIRDRRIYDSTFAPYAKTSRDLTKLVDTMVSEIELLQNAISAMLTTYGSKNICPNYAESQVIDGVTFTITSTGVINLSGTASANITLTIIPELAYYLEPGSYIINGGFGADSGPCLLSLKVCTSVGSTSGSEVYTTINLGEEEKSFIIEQEPTNAYYPNKLGECSLTFTIASGTNVDNKSISPMIRDSRIADNTYVPYAKTNRGLSNWRVEQ